MKSRKVLLVVGALIFVIFPWVLTWDLRHDIKQACEPRNPAIQAVAALIRRHCTTPFEEVALVQVAADSLLDYDLSRRVYGDGIPTVSQMLARRRSAHWLFPRGDCKEHAVIAGSLLSALDIPWEPVVSFPLRHAWVRVRLPGGEWDIMTDRIGASRLNPAQLGAVSFLAGGSAIPLRTPAAEFTAQIVDRLVAPHDAALLGLVVVTPRCVWGRAPANFTEPDRLLRAGREALGQARTAGFPLGEPL